jgi:hypothetical protein
VSRRNVHVVPTMKKARLGKQRFSRLWRRVVGSDRKLAFGLASIMSGQLKPIETGRDDRDGVGGTIQIAPGSFVTVTTRYDVAG